MPYQPLAGWRILDLSRLLPGPYCTMLLADLGAEVVKIETPRVGDYARFLPDDMGLPGLFEALNRGKQSVGLNYRNAQGRAVFLRLTEAADVVIESFRPRAVERWGIGYEAVRQHNPRIIYCSLSGYGQSGPYRDRAGHDANYLAVGGLLHLNGAAGGPPTLPGVQIADLAGGMLAAVAILGACLGRGRTGEGAYLDVALLDAVASWLGVYTGSVLAGEAAPPERGRMALSGGLPCYNVYETADGQFLALGALEPDFWAAFCRGVEREDLLPRQFDRDAVSEVGATLRARPRAEWLARFQSVDACLEPVSNVLEAVRHPQLRERGLVQESEGRVERVGVPFPWAASPRTAPAPALGSHTREVLRQAGYADEEIEALEAKSVVKIAEA